MVKYYTRACNFYYGTHAKHLIKKNHALPLCGNKNIAFNTLEIFSKNKGKINSKIISFKDIKSLSKFEKKKLKKT